MERYGENRPLADTDHPEGPAVTCSNGTFIGKEKNEVCSFKGIPYALPPVGKLRWKPPVPAEKDGGTYEAFYFGKSGIQTDAETERASLYVQGEDCLTLNVWTSDKTETEGKPVMVFIPGGAYGWGGSADPLYDGQKFIEAYPDVVLVTVNYRIGLMGFIDFSAVKGGEEYSHSGNLGLLDQICALQWVRDNIRGFGGDPKNVTLFGESAGGGSVSLLPLIDEAKGLFRRVIAQSGSIALTFSREECQSLTAKLMEETKAKTMEDLLALTEEELMELNKELNDYNNFPERDGVTVPEDIPEREILLVFNKHNVSEYTRIIIRSRWGRMDYRYTPVEPRACEKEYFEPGDVVILNDLATRYKGEVHIAMKRIRNTGTMNYVGRIAREEMFLLDYLKYGTNFGFITG